MDSQWRNFTLVFTLAAAVATPAFGQAVAPAVGPAGSEEESASSIPDFSGIWVRFWNVSRQHACVILLKPAISPR
jgi:hypothetical protein